MKYDDDFWSKYALDDSSYNAELAKYISNLATSMKAQSVLEIGCSTGNDLMGFAEDFKVHGVDLNDKALDKARTKLGTFDFQKGSITDLSFEDSSFDLVFTHKVLNYLEDAEIPKAMNEMLRVSKKYIVNFEMYGENEDAIDDKSKYRNMYKRWHDYNVKIISHVDMHEDIDPEKSQFNLVRKL